MWSLIISFAFLVCVSGYCNHEDHTRGFSTADREQGPSSSAFPYLDGDPEVIDKIVSLLTVGDSVGDYTFSGRPSAIGAYVDPGSPDFHLYISHSLDLGEGKIHDHGVDGSFLSHFMVGRNTFDVRHGEDFLRSADDIHVSQGSKSFRYLNSGEVSPSTAFFASETGTQERFFLSGETDTSTPRAFAFQLTGSSAHQAFQLSDFGNFDFESLHACPISQQKTVIAITEDDGNSIPGGLLLFYIGAKTNSGNNSDVDIDVQRAGLVGGKMYCAEIENYSEESDEAPGVQQMNLHELDMSQSMEDIRNEAESARCTQFRRPEGGRWFPSEPSQFWFVTAGSWVKGDSGDIPSDSRIWSVEFLKNEDGSLRTEQNPVATVKVEFFTKGEDSPGRQLSDIAFSRLGTYAYAVEGPLTEQYESSVVRYGPFDEDDKEFLCIGSHSTYDLSHFNTILSMNDEVGPGWYLMSDDNGTILNSELVGGGQLVFFYDDRSAYQAAPIVTHLDTTPLKPYYDPAELIQFICGGYDPNAVFGVETQPISKYIFNFGDSSESVTSDNSTAYHAYSEMGVYYATCEIADSEQPTLESQPKTIQIFIGEPPTPSPSPTPTPTRVRDDDDGENSGDKSAFGGIFLVGITFIFLSIFGIIFTTVIYCLSLK
mmetsp:Transcript_778/g.1160  ORF Transcript_778/g.1160 Transcript_778/m.1160 type:complete len:654 (-) Transcript_778:151-2112(-)